MKKVYVAGALGADPLRYADWCAKYARFGEHLAGYGYDVYVPHAHEKPQETDEECYLRDIAAIDDCDVIAAFLDHPSHGVGIELRHGHVVGKKLIGLFPPERYSGNLQSMVGGFLKHHGYPVLVYRDLAEAAASVAAALEAPRAS